MALSSKEIAPAIYSDRLVMRACSTLINAVVVALKKEAPDNMAEALDFTRNFADDWVPQPDAVICNLFCSQGTHGVIYTYSDHGGRTIELLDFTEQLEVVA